MRTRVRSALLSPAAPVADIAHSYHVPVEELDEDKDNDSKRRRSHESEPDRPPKVQRKSSTATGKGKQRAVDAEPEDDFGGSQTDGGIDLDTGDVDMHDADPSPAWLMDLEQAVLDSKLDIRQPDIDYASSGAHAGPSRVTFEAAGDNAGGAGMPGDEEEEIDIPPEYEPPCMNMRTQTMRNKYLDRLSDLRWYKTLVKAVKKAPVSTCTTFGCTRTYPAP